MERISARDVVRTWEKMSNLSPTNIPALIEEFSDQQPLILAYLLAVGEREFNQDEKELLLYLGTTVWQMMSRTETAPVQITEETLETIESSNLQMLEYLEGESDEDFIATVETIYSNYNQPDVLRHIVETLMEDEDDFVREDRKGMMLIYLKTVIDCFDKSL